MSTGSAKPASSYLAEHGLSPDRMPRHVAIIMDGNGRWAQRRGLARIEGHRQGVISVRTTVEEACRLGLEQLTLYCLSVENWKRPKLELDLLMVLLVEYLINERPTIMDNDVVLKVIGRREGLPPEVLEEMDRTIAMSASNGGTTLCLAINYGGRAEMVDAVQALARRVQSGDLDPDAIDEDCIADALYTRGMLEPDLLIRTAGERRISNFLLWQVSYSELWITDDCWPDFRPEHLRKAMLDFSQRERRYGGLDSSLAFPGNT